MNCRILYSTQSGRAKACSRRVARIVASTSTTSSSTTGIQLMNGNGTTFDNDIQQLTNNGTIQEWVESVLLSSSNNNNNNNNNESIQVVPKVLLLLFISTTGDGEHTDTIQNTWKQLYEMFFSFETNC
jgi:hypothetical protein